MRDEVYLVVSLFDSALARPRNQTVCHQEEKTSSAMMVQAQTVLFTCLGAHFKIFLLKLTSLSEYIVIIPLQNMAIISLNQVLQ